MWGRSGAPESVTAPCVTLSGALFLVRFVASFVASQTGCRFFTFGLVWAWLLQRC